jgi:environmental stress-induced protein Ves
MTGMLRRPYRRWNVRSGGIPCPDQGYTSGMNPSPAVVELVPADDYRRERWANGTGWTRVICACRLADGDIEAPQWDWRLSIAEIEADAPFSRFPGTGREQVLLSGNGLRLRFADGEARELQPPHQRLRFDGDRACTGEPVDGRVEAFNLMWRRDTVEATLWHRPLVGSMVLFVDPGTTWALYLLSGRAAVDHPLAHVDLEQGDTVLLRSEGTRTRHALDGGGEVLLVRIQPREAAR